MPRPLRALLAVALVILAAATVRADGIILDGVSPYTIGRGGTNLGFADNASMLHDNPAAMSLMNGQTMVQLGVTTLWTEFEYADADNNTRSQHQMYPLPEVGLVHRFNDEWAGGIGIFSPAGFGSIMNLNGPAFPGGPQRYSSFGSLNKLLTGVSYAPSDRFSMGATIGPALTFADLEGPYTLQGPSGLAGVPTVIDMDVDGWALVWSAGLMYKLTDTTTLGAAYQSQSRIHAHGTTDAITPIGNTTYDTDATIIWPRSVGVGVRQQLGSRHVLATDVIWFNWADAFDHFSLNMTNSSNPNLPSFYEEFPLNWRDTVSTRVGYEYHMNAGRVARVGYVHHNGASPASTLTPYIPAALENAISLGYGWMWSDWNVNLAYMYSFGPHEHAGVGGLIGGDFDNSTHYDQTHAAGVSFTKLLGAAPGCGCGVGVR